MQRCDRALVNLEPIPKPLFKKDIIPKSNDGTDYNDEKKDADKSVAFQDGKACAKQSPGKIAQRHWQGVLIKDVPCSAEEENGARIRRHVYELGVSACA